LRDGSAATAAEREQAERDDHGAAHVRAPSQEI
jgi:hypothetical protein